MAEIITRRRLPHWYVPGAMHFVTYRLAGTIPAAVIQELRTRKDQMLKAKPPAGVQTAHLRERIHKQMFADYDEYLDCTCKIDWLANPAVAAIIRRNLYHHDRVKYHLLAYCVMPNHVHVLFQPIEPSIPDSDASETASDWLDDGASPLTTIMHSLKSYTAKQANAILGRSGAFWQKESYDHWVRDDDELERIVHYISFNPVRVNLAKEPHAWYFSSAHDRFLFDGSTAGFLLDAT